MLRTYREDIAKILRRYADDFENKQKKDITIARDLKSFMEYLLEFIERTIGTPREEISGNILGQQVIENKKLRRVLKEHGIKLPKDF